MKSSGIGAKQLTAGAVLVALGVALTYLRLPLTAVTEITFTGLPIAAGAYLYGPFMGFLIGALIDICGFIMRPMGPYFPGFTISTGLIGAIYGLFLFRMRWERGPAASGLLRNGPGGLILRITLSHLLKTVLISLLLNCFWLSFFYGMPFKAVFLTSIPKEAVNFPFEVCMIYLTLRLVRNVSI